MKEAPHLPLGHPTTPMLHLSTSQSRLRATRTGEHLPQEDPHTSPRSPATPVRPRAAAPSPSRPRLCNTSASPTSLTPLAPPPPPRPAPTRRAQAPTARTPCRGRHRPSRVLGPPRRPPRRIRPLRAPLPAYTTRRALGRALGAICWIYRRCLPHDPMCRN